MTYFVAVIPQRPLIALAPNVKEMVLLVSHGALILLRCDYMIKIVVAAIFVNAFFSLTIFSIVPYSHIIGASKLNLIIQHVAIAYQNSISKVSP